MLEILMELGLSEEMAEKVILAIEKYEEEKADANEDTDEEIKEEALPEGEETEAEKEEEKPEIPPMGEADDDIPTREEFEKMGYLARLELAKVNPEAYDRLKNGR